MYQLYQYHTAMRTYFLTLLFASVSLVLIGQEEAALQDTLAAEPVTTSQLHAKSKKLIYKLDVKEDIGPAIWRKTQKAFEEAEELNADLILLHMNTYGGLVVSADSIRTKILNSPIPVIAYIDNNAASAGALISIACDSIYMRPGANIGAATVVSGEGAQMPDKYQSYMRSTMRSTAESHGKDTTWVNGKEVVKWRRSPLIAEAMVDDRVYIEGIIDTGKVLTFTTIEAMEHGYCEGAADNIAEVLTLIGVEDYELQTYTPTIAQKIIGFLVNPALQSILLMIIIGGIWFELQSPGVGFPILAAIVAAFLYFSPLLIEGFAEYWEIGLFVIGVLLILLEVFVIPGFGVAGISGIILSLVGLTLSLIGNLDFDFHPVESFGYIGAALLQVLLSIVLSFIFLLFFGASFVKTGMFRRIALDKTIASEEGFVATNLSLKEYVGKEAVVVGDLRPSGSIEVEGRFLDAISVAGFIEEGRSVKIVKFEMGQLYVEAL